MNEKTMKESREKMSFRHVMFIVTCCLIMATCTGLWFNAAGIFYNSVSQDLGVGLGSISLYITLSYFGTTLFLPFAGRLLEKYDTRKLYAFGMICMFVAFLLMWAATSVVMFYIAGILSALCVAFSLYLLPVVIGRWFKQRVGFVVGLASAFSGIGAALWNPLGAMIIAEAGWRTGYLVFGIIQIVLTLPFVLLFFRSSPAAVGLKPYGQTVETEETVKAGGSGQLSGADYSKVMKSPSFYLFCAMGIVGPLIAMVNMYLPSYAGTIGMPIMIGATLASASMIGNLLGKVIFGSVADKTTTGAVICGAAAPFIGIALMMWFAGIGDFVVIAASFIFGMCNGNAVVILPLVVRRIYGEKDYTKIWSSISPIAALFAGVGASLWGFVYDATMSYTTVFIIGLALCVVLVLLYFGAVMFAKRIPHTTATEPEVPKEKATVVAAAK